MKKITTIMLAVIFLAGGMKSLGQGYSLEKVQHSEKLVVNLNKGIASGNDGLRKSSIYLAGKYRLASTVDALIDQLNNENEPSIKILIGLALYRIGDPIGMEKIIHQSKNEKNEKVKMMFIQIYNEFQKEQNEFFSYSIN
ncbi:MAG: hypothetical protein K9H48_21675 [Melioribacteraceae bacterium]|nr:hypothetical protein [Melioribacteraceae bacterium]MCF8396510.1 hypothetical protein [Melioribacteraceae bacterium]